MENYPTMFPPDKTAVTVDVLETGFILAFVMLAFCLYLVILGTSGNYQYSLILRVTLSLLIGAILMTSNFGQEWEIGKIKTRTPYKAGEPNEITASVGVKIGLRSVNVTLLRSENDESSDNLKGEKIDYNERFSWTWDQGRFGFGPYAGELQRSFREGQRKGLPLPILWIVDYFTIDGEGIRYGRFYRTAGWYAHIAMWSAFPCWLLANILFFSVIRYGAYFTVLTGAFQVLACILWAVIRNPTELNIPFENDELTTKYGANFWLSLASGIVCIILGIVILFFDLRYPDNISVFFGIDPLSDYEEYHLTPSELEVVRHTRSKGAEQDVEMSVPNSPVETTQERTECVLKRRTTVTKAQRSLFRTPNPNVTVTNEYDDEMPLYLNVPRRGFADPIPEETTGSRHNLYQP
ncbi:hypothetical protein L9F63_005078 [Diploptera punctata]|uniref:Dual oxidase maturation factor 1 n=1 Tax=Diploptera punctata TaxID=6984 RepID=A0AAD7ZE66_DIPPU|nr:hypothetical protein L9F63_005078 [Diploptera punctata]